MTKVSTISAKQLIRGTIRAREDLKIDGRVQGRIESEAQVIVSESAIIEASIQADRIYVQGVVVGDLQGNAQIEIAPTGQVLGKISTPQLSLRPGGRIQGEVDTGQNQGGFSSHGRSVRTDQWAPSPAPSARFDEGEFVESSFATVSQSEPAPTSED